MDSIKKLINVNLPLQVGEEIIAYGDGYVTVKDIFTGDITRKNVCTVRYGIKIFVGIAPTKSNYLYRQDDGTEFYRECLKHSPILEYMDKFNYRWREETPTVYENGDYSPLTGTLILRREEEEHRCYLQTGGPF